MSLVNDTFTSEADQLLESLTHGPTPAVQGWEIEESCYDEHGASAILIVDGQSFHVRVTKIANGE